MRVAVVIHDFVFAGRCVEELLEVHLFFNVRWINVCGQEYNYEMIPSGRVPFKLEKKNRDVNVEMRLLSAAICILQSI
jgi:hypothetical protein